MKPHYTKSAVEPVQAALLSKDTLQLRYKVLPETAYYSKGVDYQVNDGVMRVYINRCGIKQSCHPMAETRIPLGAAWEAEVHLPYHGEQVIVVHGDGDQVVYP